MTSAKAGNIEVFRVVKVEKTSEELQKDPKILIKVKYSQDWQHFTDSETGCDE